MKESSPLFLNSICIENLWKSKNFCSSSLFVVWVKPNSVQSWQTLRFFIRFLSQANFYSFNKRIIYFGFKMSTLNDYYDCCFTNIREKLKNLYKRHPFLARNASALLVRMTLVSLQKLNEVKLLFHNLKNIQVLCFW